MFLVKKIAEKQKTVNIVKIFLFLENEKIKYFAQKVVVLATTINYEIGRFIFITKQKNAIVKFVEWN